MQVRYLLVNVAINARWLWKLINERTVAHARAILGEHNLAEFGPFAKVVGVKLGVVGFGERVDLSECSNKI